MRMCVGELAPANLAQELLGSLASRLRNASLQYQSEGDVVESGQPRIELGLRKNQGVIGPWPGDGLTIIDDSP
jgi:hypothetical protein